MNEKLDVHDESRAEGQSLLNDWLEIDAALRRAQLKSVIVIFPVPPQERLPANIEKILYDNLWEMYES